MARKKGTKSTKPSYAIVGDGHTEKIYFDEFKRFEGISHVHVKPELPVQAGSYVGVLEKAEELINEGYDRVYAIIDLDDIITKNIEHTFQSDIKKLDKEIKTGNLVMIYCNPCFEIWFLLHFGYTTKNFRRCSGVENDIKKTKKLKGYSKTRKFLKNIKIYEKLRPNLINTAIPNSEKLSNSQSSATGKRHPKCLVHKIFKDLGVG